MGWRRTNAAHAVVALALLLSQPQSGRAQAANHGQDAPFAVDVATFSPTLSVLWVGLANRTGEARLVCITEHSAIFGEGGAGWVERGAVRECDDAQFYLVPAGQTHFVRITSSQRRPMRPQDRIRVNLSAVDKPVVGDALRSGAYFFDLPLEEAVSAGRALAKGR
jgi:hypothetical protein